MSLLNLKGHFGIETCSRAAIKILINYFYCQEIKSILLFLFLLTGKLPPDL